MVIFHFSGLEELNMFIILTMAMGFTAYFRVKDYQTYNFKCSMHCMSIIPHQICHEKI